jgi:hypothetical protein
MIADRNARIDALQEKLTTAVESLVTGEDWRRASEFAARFRAASFGNTLLIYLQHAEAFERGRVPAPEPTYVAGFRQWQRLGRCVVKGQFGYMIRSRSPNGSPPTDPSNPNSWRRLKRGEQPAPGMTGARRRAEMFVDAENDPRLGFPYE